MSWYRKSWVRIALRIAGLAILASAWFEGRTLSAWVHAQAGGTAQPASLLLAGATFLSASFGSALTIVGGGLWERVQLSQRWAMIRSLPPLV